MHYLLLASFLWGTSFVAGKFSESTTDLVIIVQLRMLIAALFVLPAFLKYFKQIDSKLWLKLSFVSFLTFPLTFMLQFIGLKYTTASSAAIMIGFEPLLIVVAGHLFFKEKALPKDIILSLVAFIGVLLVIGIPRSTNFHFLGCLLVLLSTFAVAIWVRLSKQLIHKVPNGAYTPITFILGTVLTLPFTILLTEEWRFNPSIVGISSILYLGIGCSLIAGWAWNKGLSKSTANSSGLILALEPIFGVLFGVILLQDSFSDVATIGVMLVLLSVLLSVKFTWHGLFIRLSKIFNIPKHIK